MSRVIHIFVIIFLNLSAVALMDNAGRFATGLSLVFPFLIIILINLFRAYVLSSAYLKFGVTKIYPFVSLYYFFILIYGYVYSHSEISIFNFIGCVMIIIGVVIIDGRT